MEGHIPDIILERYLLNELPEKRYNEISKALEADIVLQERIAAIKESNKKILKDYPVEYISEVLKFKLNSSSVNKAPKKSFFKRIQVPVLSFGAVAILLVFMMPFMENYIEDRNSISEITRLKGVGAKIFIYKNNTNGAELLKRNSLVSESDIVGVTFFIDKTAYGIIVSIDGRGVVTKHFPNHGDRSPRLIAGKNFKVGHSYELDDAPEYEKFFLIYSVNEFEIDDLLKKIKKAATNKTKVLNDNLGIDKSKALVSFTLRKKK